MAEKQCIPFSCTICDYIEYLAWHIKGNTDVYMQIFLRLFYKEHKHVIYNFVIYNNSVSDNVH